MYPPAPSTPPEPAPPDPSLGNSINDPRSAMGSNTVPQSLKDKDSFIHYIFKVVQEKLKSIDKRLSEQGHSGMEGADVILGHLKNMAQVLINYAGIY